MLSNKANIRSLFRLLIALGLAAALAACGGVDSGNSGNNWDGGKWDQARWQ